jgi:hypothetical protein
VALLDTFSDYERRHLTIVATQMDIGTSPEDAHELARSEFAKGRTPPKVTVSDQAQSSPRGARYSILGPGLSSWPDRCDRVVETLITLAAPLQAQFAIWSGQQPMLPVDLSHLGLRRIHYVPWDAEWGRLAEK